VSTGWICPQRVLHLLAKATELLALGGRQPVGTLVVQIVWLDSAANCLGTGLELPSEALGGPN